MSKKMVLLSLLVSTTVLTTSIKSEGVTVTNSSDIATTQDTELLTSSDGSMNVFMEKPQTETSTSATDISSSDATMSSSVSEAIVDSVDETTPTETEVIVPEEEDVIVPEEEVTVSKEEVFPDQVLTTTQVTEETTVSMPSVSTITTLESKNEPTINLVSATKFAPEVVTKSAPEVVPIAEPINERVNAQSTEVKPVGTLTDLRQKPVGTLTALQMLPETSSVSSKTSVVVGVVLTFFGLIGSLYMYAKRIFG